MIMKKKKKNLFFFLGFIYSRHKLSIFCFNGAIVIIYVFVFIAGYGSRSAGGYSSEK
jgi:hypothetical protein